MNKADLEGASGGAAAVWVEVAALTPWADNPRQNDKAIREVERSIARFGFAAPIVANLRDSTIIAGHTRFAAAQRLGLERVPVRWLDLEPADARALALADNRLGEIATWDDDKLRDVLRELRDADATLLTQTGFSDAELRGLLGEAERDLSQGGGPANEQEWTLMLSFDNEAELQAAFAVAKERAWRCKIIE